MGANQPSLELLIRRAAGAFAQQQSFSAAVRALVAALPGESEDAAQIYAQTAIIAAVGMMDGAQLDEPLSDVALARARRRLDHSLELVGSGSPVGIDEGRQYVRGTGQLAERLWHIKTRYIAGGRGCGQPGP